MTKGSLIWRLGLTLLVVQAVVGAALAVYAVNQLRSAYYQTSVEHLRTLWPLLADRYAASDEQDLEIWVQEDAKSAAIRITLIDPTGRVVADSHSAATTMDNHRNRPEIAAALTDGQGSAVRYSATLGHDTMYFAQVLRRDDQAVGVLRTAVPLAQVDTQLAVLMRAVLIAGAAWLAVTIGAIVYFSTRLSRSVSRLGTDAQRFAAGELDHRIVSPGGGEFAALTNALNEMARQLEARLSELDVQRAEQDAIMRSMEAGVIALDQDQRVLRINRAAAQMLGTSEHEARGRLVQELSRQPDLNAFVLASLQNQQADRDEFEMVGPVKRAVRAAASPLRNAEGQPVGLIIVLDDITLLRRLESMRSDFAANVSHELRTPITNIKGYAETLLDGVDDGDQARGFLKIVAQNANRLGSIVEDMLELTRLERPEFQASLELEPADIRSVFKAVAEQYAFDAGAKTISIRIEVESELRIPMNRPLLEQAIGNLVSNAIKYSPERTTVRLTAAACSMLGGKPGLQIDVIDQGPGIDPQGQPRLFERFYRVDKARSRQLGGTGLGLAIVKHIAIVHGGSAQVRSEPGSGSTFSIILPA